MILSITDRNPSPLFFPHHHETLIITKKNLTLILYLIHCRCSSVHSCLVNVFVLLVCSDQDPKESTHRMGLMCLSISNTPLPCSCRLLVEKPGHWIYRIFHVLGLSDCFSVVAFDMVFYSLTSCRPIVKPRGLIKFKVSFGLVFAFLQLHWRWGIFMAFSARHMLSELSLFITCSDPVAIRTSEYKVPRHPFPNTCLETLFMRRCKMVGFRNAVIPSAFMCWNSSVKDHFPWRRLGGSVS